MKKFCSTCGNQLELSQRFCSQCGAVNPFFVPAFTLLSDQSQTLEQLRMEKERIEKELSAKETAQKEFEHQQQLKKDLAELEKQKAEQLEQERMLREKIEREKIETNLKKEILRVKEEAELNKKETIDLVREVRKEVKQEIQEIGEENKRLKHEVAILSKQFPEKTEPVAATGPALTLAEAETQPEPVSDFPQEPKTKYRAVKVVLAMVLLMWASLGYFYFTGNPSEQTALLTEPVKAETETVQEITPAPAQRIVDTILQGDVPVDNSESVIPEPVPVSKAMVTSTPKGTVVKKASVTKAEAEKPISRYTVTEAKVMTDLNGRKISGCGVIIGSDAELRSINNLVLVEKTPAYNKYKCTLKIAQGSDTYIAIPYLYYTDDGAIIRVDGTNCE